ncbi:hypothetical protein CXG81DRAFT_25922 [Caulochytrium protostelioides]|uniref:S-adenosyl-L-methionine-dependent methyltransferase n=1 Tax=Caulochytrium protostelioides TaxID=1555241 RepID=A0A4P9WXR8_9FUNG|nr:S-adenosyl-L-methionine-dependent methyltransferase [Caulochytrium protostelioides]RKP01373.1 hypothetical protein CXG81DRAFT_25922 [Caulochytrium protostelioides]|eukprot:RKP01373.1 hypothetical protein CXG81DRAFT_25922 [Caulochytrium protostelioides]
MRVRDLESALQPLRTFETPKIRLEQYGTPPVIAAPALLAAHHEFDDFEGHSVIDLGTGPGILGITCAILGADHVIGIDADPDALAIAADNVEQAEVEMDLIAAFVTDPAPADGDRANESDVWSRLRADTVIMNPPFGTKTAPGADMMFLRRALSIATRAVYSMHKTSTREYVQRQAQRAGWNAHVVGELKYNLPASYRFHKRKSVNIEVDFIRFTPNASDSEAASDSD